MVCVPLVSAFSGLFEPVADMQEKKKDRTGSLALDLLTFSVSPPQSSRSERGFPCLSKAKVADPYVFCFF